VVAYYFDSADINHAFLYSSGAYTNIDDPLGADGSFAHGTTMPARWSAPIPTDSAGITHGFIASAAAKILGSGQTLFVSSGQTSDGVTVLGSATLAVLSGGVAISTVISSGGTENDSGLTDGTTVSGGLEVLYSGGTASSSVIGNGAEEYIAVC